MSALPVVSGREVAKALEKIGYVFDRQRGSHMILRQQNPPHRRLTVPDHKEVAKGTFRAIIRQAGFIFRQCHPAVNGFRWVAADRPTMKTA